LITGIKYPEPNLGKNEKLSEPEDPLPPHAPCSIHLDSLIKTNLPT
jgi:hypothetical protein